MSISVIGRLVWLGLFGGWLVFVGALVDVAIIKVDDDISMSVIVEVLECVDDVKKERKDLLQGKWTSTTGVEVGWSTFEVRGRSDRCHLHLITSATFRQLTWSSADLAHSPSNSYFSKWNHLRLLLYLAQHRPACGADSLQRREPPMHPDGPRTMVTERVDEVMDQAGLSL